MPYALLQYRALVSPERADHLGNHLGRMVAEALSCSNPDGHLSAEDVEVEVRPISDGMKTNFNLQITVDANDYPERRVDLKARQERLNKAIHHFFHANREAIPKGWVWVRLFPASFSEL